MKDLDLKAFMAHYFADLKRYAAKVNADRMAATDHDERLLLEGQNLAFIIAIDRAENLLGPYHLIAKEVGLES